MMSNNMPAVVSDAPNEALENFLIDFVNAKDIPPFAVLIDGSWGSGKTHFVRRLINEGRLSNAIYVSLYGLRERDDIERAILASIYPITTDKSAAVLGKLLMGGLKVFRFDPNISLKDVLDLPKERVFIFDDMERSNVDPEIMMGFISQLMAETGSRAILIGNESELTKNNDYSRTKEKVVGWTFKYKPETKKAIDFFVDRFKGKDVFKVLDTQRNLLVEISEKSGDGNLRVMEQSLYDFSRLAGKGVVPDEAGGQGTKLLKICLISSIEHRLDRLNRSTLSQRAVRYTLNNDDRAVALNALKDRYNFQEFDDAIISTENLIKYVFEGEINVTDVKHDIVEAVDPPEPTDEPIWRQLLSYFRGDIDQWKEVYNSLDHRFDNLELTVPGELLHIFSLLTYLSRERAIETPTDEIVINAKKYFAKLRAEGLLPPSTPGEYFDDGRYGSWGGYGFVDSGTPEFGEIYTALKDERDAALADTYPAILASVLAKLDSDVPEFARMVSGDGEENQRYIRIPFFSGADPEKILDKIKSNAADRQLILSAFQSRYEPNNVLNYLKPELPWIVELGNAVTEYAAKLDKLSSHQLLHGWKWVAQRYETFLKQPDDNG